jgi:heat shock protein HtpX
MATHKKPTGMTASGPRRGVIIWRLIWTWLQTLLGFALMGSLVAGAFMFFGFNWSWGVGLLTLWMVIPMVAWYNSARMVKRLTGCKAPDPSNPDHMRLVKIVDRLYPKTGLPVKPPVYISPIKLPNAFATGRTPRDAFIACTEGLFLVGLTDDELEGVIAHELAHVKHFDVAMNSLLAVLGSLFGILLAAGIPRWFHPTRFSSGSPLLDRLSDRVTQKKQFFLPVGGFLGFVVMLVIFYLVSFFTKFISLFVARARESAADAQAAYWTGKPCALSTALQKIVVWVTLHSADLRETTVTRGLTPLTIVNTLTEGDPDGSTSGGIGTRLRRWWQRLGENHPPVAERVKTLDRMNGGACPRVRIK